ncbi:MAG: hypothetical protein KGV56_05400 [Gammaproteobacteria bacterium]|nr:hypothetical protein [Gammaproteobacteria bacterium]
MDKNFLNPILAKQIYQDEKLNKAITNEIIKFGGVDDLDFWYGWQYEGNDYDLNVYDYTEYGKDVLCIVAYIVEFIDGFYTANYEKVAAKIFLDKTEWQRCINGISLHQSYNSLAQEVEAIFKLHIANGLTYQYDDSMTDEEIEANAIKIDYNCAYPVSNHSDIGYLIAIDNSGIEIMTKEYERTTLSFDMLNNLVSKIMIVEKLTDFT